jgi:hypothetical protein
MNPRFWCCPLCNVVVGAFPRRSWTTPSALKVKALHAMAHVEAGHVTQTSAVTG